VIDLRIGHYYALSKWRPDYFSLVMVESLATRGLAPRFGREPEWEILLTNNISFGDARLALIHAPYDETLGRFVRFMADNETEIDAVLGNMGTESAGQEIQAKT
jgi:hypothetical protein